MDGVYSQELRLKNRDVDMHRRLRTSRLFELLQEAAIAHTEALGMGREKTLDRGLLWVVTLQRAEIARMPEYDELVHIATWPGNTMHILFPRYYRITDAAGNALIEASALWALMDRNTRKVIFPEEHGVAIKGMRTGKEIPLPRAPKIPKAEESEAFTVPYSYVDLNGHMNNTTYFDLAEDIIPDAAECKELTMIEAEYVNEARYGEEITVRWGREGGRVYLTGERDKTVVRMAFTYKR